MSKIYDVVILGAGPAGLSAGLYAGRSRLSTLIIEKGQDGGQIAITDDIENYPGSPNAEPGPVLIARMSAQVEKFGAERVKDTIKSVDLKSNPKKITCVNGEYLAKTVIVATGAFPKPAGSENEGKFVGKGVSYCATCDANFFEDFEVFVVGGGDSAIQEALYLTKFARKVTVVHRREELRAAKSLQEKAFANPKMAFMWNSVIRKFDGDDILNTIEVENIKTGEISVIHADEEDGIFGVFVFIGFNPRSELVADQLDIENGYILTDDDMKTNIPGVFAAGDVRKKSFRQVVTAAADGAIAVHSVEHYLSENE
ncbi:MAG: thioredoxin-disulfide reductase [Oscillospiraceae bacterium]